MHQIPVAQTAVIRGRGERLAAITRMVGRRPNSFIPVPDPAGKLWFIVKTNPQCELRAVESLLRVGIHAYAPVYRKRLFEERSKKRIVRTTPFIVGYVFALVPADNLDFGLIRDCDGVAGILPLAEGQRPIAFANRYIEAMRREEATHWLEQDLEFRPRKKRWLSRSGIKTQPGRKVIGSGAFEGFVAAITRLEGRSNARIVTQAFGTLQEVVLPLDELLDAA